MRFLLGLVFSLFLPMVACDSGGADAPGVETPPTGAPAWELTVTGDGGAQATVRVEAANTSEERQLGLMHRQSMPEDRGMLFVFPHDTTTGFWMRNTLIPLTIAYIAEDGTVMELREGIPLDDKNVLTPAQPYRYVLEVNSGWFQRHNLGVGAKVTLPGDLPPGE